MIRKFCDLCSKEITDENVAKKKDNRCPGNANRLSGTWGVYRQGKPELEMFVEVDVAGVKGRGWGDDGILDRTYDVCKYCVIDLVNRFDDRPKCEPSAPKPRDVDPL